MVALAPEEPRVQRIGPYEVLLAIGSGGMGKVSLACATGAPVGASGFARLVAIKRPHGALASDEEVLSRFLDEARLLAQVHHANVVGIHQIGTDAVGHFLVLDYIEGGSLDELVTRSILHRKKLPPPIVLRVACDMLAGLHAVHEAAGVEGKPLRMLHRDVSTQNVLVGRDGVARLADFGIAKAIISSIVTDRAYLQGRVPYMAPEYLRREEVDRRLDVYAAGVTVWAALAGKLPWEDAAEAQVIHHAVYRGIPPLSSAGVTVAPAIEELVARACARDPAERFASAEEMSRAIEELGRRTGWLASHADVASLVEVLLGGELRARRAAIAERLSAPGRGASAAALATPVPAGAVPAVTAVTAVPAAGAGAVSAAGAVPVSAVTAAAAVGAGAVSAVTAAAAVGAGAVSAVTAASAVGAAPVPSVTLASGGVVAVQPGVVPLWNTKSALPAGPVGSPGRTSSGRGRVGLLVAAVAALSGGVVAWTFWEPGRPTPDDKGAAASGEAPAEAGSAPATVQAAPSGPAAAGAAPSSRPAATAGAEAAPSAVPSTTAAAGGGARPSSSPRPPGVPTALPTGISTANPYRK